MFVYWRYGGAPPPPSSRQSGNKLISWTAATWLQDKNASHPPPIKTGICSYRKHCQTFQPNFPSRLFDAVLLPSIQGVFEKNCITQWWNVCRQFNFAVQVGHQSPSWPKNCGQVHSTGRSARTPTIIFTAVKGKLTTQIQWSLFAFFKTCVILWIAWAQGNTMPLIDFIHKICNLLIPCDFLLAK